MKHRLTKTAAAAVIAAAAIFAVPAAASAYNTPEPVGGTSVSLPAGGSGVIAFDDFQPNEPVTFTLTGRGVTGANIAVVKTAAVSSASVEKQANAEGVASAEITLPANASGEYTLSAVGAVSGPAAAVTITAGAAGGGTGTLPATGGDNAALLGLWIGGGALVLAGGSIAVASTVRRHRNAEVAA